jgi:hypothetical protein
MSIFHHLEQQSAEDVRLLNLAMGLLYALRTGYAIDDYTRLRIDELEAQVMAHRKLDHRFRASTVAFDLNKYPVCHA